VRASRPKSLSSVNIFVGVFVFVSRSVGRSAAAAGAQQGAIYFTHIIYVSCKSTGASLKSAEHAIILSSSAHLSIAINVW
jgi:hypothetical protein